tara:strand:- start:148 stop:1086 length:939 start_codon:yes stop_codon:yes gene_type:complete
MSDLFRNYDNKNPDNSVEVTYRNMLINQKMEYSIFALNTISSRGFIYNIWTIINKLDEIVDESDPDTDLPQIIHSYQTAESIRKNYIQNNMMLKRVDIRSLFTDKEWNDVPHQYKNLYNTTIDKLYSHIKYWDWFILVGFIHDLGKVLLLPEFGELPQYMTVGDTFPLGNKLDKNYVFYDKGYHNDNPDLNLDLYLDNCGFDNVIFSWGHDEYLAKTLELNKTNLPPEAIYIIRYHSFYSWHTPSNGIMGYKNMASQKDWYMLPLLKCFQKADLYSKTPNIPDNQLIRNLFDLLIDKYIPGKVLKMASCFFI